MLSSKNFFLVRTPSFSTNKLEVMNQNIKKKDIESIKEIFNDKFFLDAIYFSSRYFYSVAKGWIENKTIKFDLEDSVLISLYKYYVRICTRATPYGLFAGFSSGVTTNKETGIEFENKMYLPILRTDILFLKKIISDIVDENLDKNISFYPNNTIYNVGDELRYIEWNSDFNYEISKVENNFILNKIIEKSHSGLTFNDIQSIIKKELPEADKEEVNTFIENLIKNKILVTQTPPFITSGLDPLKESKDFFKELNIKTNKIDVIKKNISSQKQSINVNSIEKLALKNSSLIDDKTQVFQIDTKLNLKNNNINQSITNCLVQDVEDVLRTTKPNKSKRVTDFCQNFYSRYENKEIPLVEALDPQLGVGYDHYVSGNIEETPLLSNLYFSFPNSNERNKETPPIVKLILKKYLDCITSNKPIILTEEDIKSISINVNNAFLCEDYCLFGNLISESSKELDKGNFKFYSKASIPSPHFKNLSSRFAYHDNELKKEIGKNLIKETEYIYAEIVHYPSDRIGNILLRPNFHNYEIPYTSPNNGNKKKININDIMVSVRGDKVILRSKSKNKYIIPRFSTAYNYELSQLSIIKFFCDLQYHNKYTGFYWNWSILNDNDFLPRVEYRNLILTEARWRLKKYKKANHKYLLEKFQELGIPRSFNIKEGDNVLTLDLENEISLNIILKKLKKGNLYIYECINEENIVKSKQGTHSAEFIFPIVTKRNKKKSLNQNFTDKKIEVNDKFLPTSEWTYFKIYCSHSTADDIIGEVIKPIIENEKSISFFIRYSDPDNHLRFRIKSNEIKRLSEELMYRLNPFTEIDFVSRVQIDTYNREIERYGVHNMDLTEEFFYYDSLAVSKFLNLFSNSNEELRWRVAIISIDILLDDFGIPYKDRVVLFSELYEGFLPEFVDLSNVDDTKNFKRSIDKKVRENKIVLDDILRLKNYKEDINIFVKPFKERSANLKHISFLIKDNFPNERDFLDLLKSYIHMTLNRIFQSKARMHELIIYFFMYRQYNSNIKRNERQC